jgi:cytochrome bd ubiquinol oxidase subunit I
MRGGRQTAVTLTAVAVALLLVAGTGVAQEAATREYGDFPIIGARGAVWIAAQVHLMFAAFVLGVPMFAVVMEAVGIFGRDEKYDRWRRSSRGCC